MTSRACHAACGATAAHRNHIAMFRLDKSQCYAGHGVPTHHYVPPHSTCNQYLYCCRRYNPPSLVSRHSDARSNQMTIVDKKLDTSQGTRMNGNTATSASISKRTVTVTNVTCYLLTSSRVCSAWLSKWVSELLAFTSVSAVRHGLCCGAKCGR